MVPIVWDSEQQAWQLHPVVTCTTVVVYDKVLPLRMKPREGRYGSQEFESFVEGVFQPYFSEHPEPVIPDETEIAPKGVSPSLGVGLPSVDGVGKGGKPKSGAGSAAPGSAAAGPGVVSDVLSSKKSPFDSSFAEVERVIDTRVRKGVRQYKVKWKGFNNRYNVWRDEDDLECGDLIETYNSALLGFSRSEVMSQLLCLTMMVGVAGSVTEVLPGLDVTAAVSKLVEMHGFDCESSDFEKGYVTELTNMCGRRLELVDKREVDRVRAAYPVVPMRMILEWKKDGRKKGRLVLQGFREPAEWDIKSNASPVAFASTIRTLLFSTGRPGDVISSIDVSVAFLQADEYLEGETPRYVSYRPYKGSEEYVFRLKGPVYGQRSAPRAWYDTVRAWMVSEMGYTQCKNDRCLFIHPKSGHKVCLHVCG